MYFYKQNSILFKSVTKYTPSTNINTVYIFTYRERPIRINFAQEIIFEARSGLNPKTAIRGLLNICNLYEIHINFARKQ